MIDHTSVRVSSYEASKDFYSKALAPLGYTVAMDLPDYKAAGFEQGGRRDFWIGESDKDGVTHVAFGAQSKTEVDAFYQAALAAGGTDNGAPGYRKDYSAGYYAAFVYDPSHNNVEVVYRDPNPTE